MNAASAIFTRIGIAMWLSTGAVAINARMRTNGHRNAVSQPFSCA